MQIFFILEFVLRPSVPCELCYTFDLCFKEYDALALFKHYSEMPSLTQAASLCLNVDISILPVGRNNHKL